MKCLIKETKKFKKKGFEISKDCELWFKNVLIAEKDDIADYYLKKYSQHFEPIN